jgi:hypothetical protein
MGCLVKYLLLPLKQFCQHFVMDENICILCRHIYIPILFCYYEISLTIVSLKLRLTIPNEYYCQKQAAAI